MSVTVLPPAASRGKKTNEMEYLPKLTPVGTLKKQHSIRLYSAIFGESRLYSTLHVSTNIEQQTTDMETAWSAVSEFGILH